MPGIVEMAAWYWNNITIELVAPAGIIFKHLCHTDRLAANVADGATGGTALDFGDQRCMFADTAGDLVHYATAG